MGAFQEKTEVRHASHSHCSNLSKALTDAFQVGVFSWTVCQTTPLTAYLIHKKKKKHRLEFTMTNLSLSSFLVQQVESFPLTLNTWSSKILLEAKSSNCIVVAADKQLLVYSLKGALLASFKDHTMPISSICVVGCFSFTLQRNFPSLVLNYGICSLAHHLRAT